MYYFYANYPHNTYVCVVNERSKHTDTKEPDTDWSKQYDSQIVGNAHVQSQLSFRFEASYDISSTDNLEVIIQGFKMTHTNLDENMKRHLSKISINVEQNIGLAAEQAQAEQCQLLAYDPQYHESQEKLYEEWLQK